MKISGFVEQIAVDIQNKIKTNFKLDKKFDMSFDGKACAFCGDKNNHKSLPSTSWTYVQYCWKCNHINIVYVQDRMSGVYTDVIECYTDKDE